MSTFNRTVKFVKRIPSLELVTHFTWSVLHTALNNNDILRVIDALSEIATSPKTNFETGEYENPFSESE